MLLLKNGIRIKYLFRLQNVEFTYREIKALNVKVIKGDGGSGPGYIEFPELRLSIITTNDKKYIFSSKQNSQLQEIEVEINRKIKPSS